MQSIEFPFPFVELEAYNEDGDKALTVVDLHMFALSYALRQKPSWWTKMKDETIRSRWRAEALEHEMEGEKLKPAEVDWVLNELEDYAAMRDEETSIQPSCYVRVWESDALVSHALKERLKAAVFPLENVSDAEKDWHPRANNLVLDLVHPSLFCGVYGRTQCWTDGSEGLTTLDNPNGDLDSWSYSDKFCWIPTDFQLADDGGPAKAIGYINNVHPVHNKDLVSVIEELVGRFSLLWDRVLTDIHPTNNADIRGGIGKVPQSYEWTAHPDHPEPQWKDRETIGAQEYSRRRDEYEEHKIISLPTVAEWGYQSSVNNPLARETTYSIQGRVVQVIAKLANIHLTPETPEYPGGSWHVEGMADERIVASGIYYYDCENITDSHLAFRVGVNFEDAGYEQSDSQGVKLTYGLDYGGPSNQVVGAVKTSVNRCIAFPNIYQHQVSSFKLIDPTKPGHRKIVALFLVDPENRIPSSTDIPPQQAHWVRETLHQAFSDRRTVNLPVEIVDMVADQMDNAMTLAEAKVYREELMDERTSFVDTVNEQHFCTDFNFCEH